MAPECLEVLEITESLSTNQPMELYQISNSQHKPRSINQLVGVPQVQ
jgi:hypothetical protein